MLSQQDLVVVARAFSATRLACGTDDRRRKAKRLTLERRDAGRGQSRRRHRRIWSLGTALSLNNNLLYAPGLKSQLIADADCGNLRYLGLLATETHKRTLASATLHFNTRLLLYHGHTDTHDSAIGTSPQTPTQLLRNFRRAHTANHNSSKDTAIPTSNPVHRITPPTRHHVERADPHQPPTSAF